MVIFYVIYTFWITINGLFYVQCIYSCFDTTVLGGLLTVFHVTGTLSVLSRNLGKSTFGHVRPAKIQISLCIYTV